jgi:CVNH domain
LRTTTRPELSGSSRPLSFVNGREWKVKIVSGLFGAAALAGFSVTAYAQGLPPGSYQQSCRDFRMQGGTLTAVCRRANGRGDQLTALNVTHCTGDIGNNNGQLVCNGGRPAAPAPPPSREAQAPAYPGPGYAPQPGYPTPGYGSPPRYGEERGYRERCEGLRHEEHELRDRLAYAPYGEERERLQYRLGQVHNEREQCWRR